MLFSASMGIGLLFGGVAEPISRFHLDPRRAERGTTAAARAAMLYSFRPCLAALVRRKHFLASFRAWAYIPQQENRRGR